MEIYWAAALIITNLVWAALAIFLIKNEDKEKKDLRDRFMARDFSEYKYHTEELPLIQKERIEELKNQAKKKKKEKPLTPEEREVNKIAERF